MPRTSRKLQHTKFGDKPNITKSKNIDPHKTSQYAPSHKLSSYIPGVTDISRVDGQTRPFACCAIFQTHPQYQTPICVETLMSATKRYRNLSHNCALTQERSQRAQSWIRSHNRATFSNQSPQRCVNQSSISIVTFPAQLHREPKPRRRASI